MENQLSITEMKFFAQCQAICLLIVTTLLCVFDALHRNANTLELWCCLTICTATVVTLCCSKEDQPSAYTYWVKRSLLYLVFSLITLLFILSMQ